MIYSSKTPPKRSEEAKGPDSELAGTTWLTKDAAGFFAFASALIVGGQAIMFFIQLRYMRKGMEDATMAAKATKISADAALKSAKTAEAALIATDRAWISIKAEIIGPLVFEKDRVHIGVGFDMTNIGKSPATNLELHAYLCCDIIEAKERAKKSADLTRYVFSDYGVVLFPDESREDDRPYLQMPIGDFMKGIEAAKAGATASNAEDSTSFWDGSLVRPAIMVCARYRLAGSTSRHHTIILFEITHTNESHFGWDGNEGETGLVFLKLVQTFLSGQVT